MNLKVRKDLNASLWDGLHFSLMVGLGESFLSAYVLARGFSEFRASMITSAPLIAGALLQLISPFGMARLKSYRNWVLGVSIIQAISLLLLATTVPIENLSYWAIFAFAAIYWGMGMAAGPAWNAWVNDLVPVRLRTTFFSRRSLGCHLFTFLGLVAGGLILHFAKNNGFERESYGLLFFLASSFRFISVTYLARQSLPRSLPSPAGHGLWSLGRSFTHSPRAKFMIFLLLFQLATYFSAGLFTPYMLKELGLSYFAYMALVATSLIARVLTLTFAKPIIEHFGLMRVFYLALALIIPVPWLWTFGSQYSYLVLLQALAGMGWGFYELVAFLTLFNELPLRDRPQVLTFYNLLQTVGVVLGSLAGGSIFEWAGQQQLGYFTAFTASTIFRILALVALPGVPWALIRIRSWVELRPLSVRAHGGIWSRPMIPVIPLRRRRKAKPTE